MSNFFNQKLLPISKVKNRQFTFSKPAPEASPVLTLGITSKGQVRTRSGPTGDSLNGLVSLNFILLTHGRDILIPESHHEAHSFIGVYNQVVRT